MMVMMQGDQGRDRMGRTAVHYAAIDGDVDGLRGFVAVGADLDAEDSAGWTPLHFAAQAQNSLIAGAPTAALDSAHDYFLRMSISEFADPIVVALSISPPFTPRRAV
jgi:hypothetical protein